MGLSRESPVPLACICRGLTPYFYTSETLLTATAATGVTLLRKQMAHILVQTIEILYSGEGGWRNRVPTMTKGRWR